MKKSLIGLLISLIILSACYPQKDEMVIYTFGPGNRVQAVFHDHNIRLLPPEQPPDPAAEKEYVRRFLAGDDDRSRALKKAGAEGIERKVIRERHPLEMILSAKLRSVDLLVDFWKQQSDDHIKFTLAEKDEGLRLSVEIREDEKEGEKALSVPDRYPQSITKFVYEGYRIVESQGFIVSSNQLSAVLDMDYLLKELRENKKAILFITWIPFRGNPRGEPPAPPSKRQVPFRRK